MSGSSNKRIVQIVADGTQGGGTTFVLALLEGLADFRARGIATCLICQQESYLLHRGRALGAEVFGADFFRARLDPAIVWNLWRTLQSIRPDVVHVHGSRAAYSLSFLPRSHSWPLLYTVHGYHFRQNSLARRLLGAAAERFISSRVDKTIFVSESDKRIAQQWRLISPIVPSCVIRNAVDVGSIPRAKDRQPRLIAFSGRLTFQKDPLLFVDIARELVSEGYSFVMLGGGELETAVRHRIAAYRLESAVELRTGLSREAAFETLRQASACVLTSRWEGLPLVPLESMVMGVPVVSARLDCMTEIINSGVSGILVPERTPLAFATAIRQLTTDQQLHESMAQAARDKVLKQFAYDRFLTAYFTLYGLNPDPSTLTSSLSAPTCGTEK